MEIPPLFKQGASARVRVTVFALISVVMLVVDARMHVLGTLRQALGTALYPFQTVAMVPRDAFTNSSEYFSSLASLQKENRELRQQQIVNAQLMQ